MPVVFTITWGNIAYYIITVDKKLIYALGLEKFESFKLVYNAAWVFGLIQGLVSIVLFTQGLVSVFLFKIGLHNLVFASYRVYSHHDF